MKQLVTESHYTSCLYVEAVSANLKNTVFQGVVTCRERRENGKYKILWKKRMGQKMVRTSKYDAMMDAYNWAEDLIMQNKGVSCEIRILGDFQKP